MSYGQRSKRGAESEQFVIRDLQARGWHVHELGRNQFPAWLNAGLRDFRDSYDWPCTYRWQPDLMIMRPDDPASLRAVDVKCHRGDFGIEQRALITYQFIESVFHCPVKIVFHSPELHPPNDLVAIAAGKAMLAAIPHRGNPEYGSGSPLFSIDGNHTSPMERFFGPKRSA